MLYHKAHYSLDADDQIERFLVSSEPTVEEKAELRAEDLVLRKAMYSLTKKQFNRIIAYIFSNLTFSQIATLENVDESSIRESIKGAFLKLKKNIDNNTP